MRSCSARRVLGQALLLVSSAPWAPSKAAASQFEIVPFGGTEVGRLSTVIPANAFATAASSTTSSKL